MLTRAAQSPMHVLAMSDAVRTSHAYARTLLYAHAFVCARTGGYRSANASHRRQTHIYILAAILSAAFTCRTNTRQLYVCSRRDEKDSAVKLFARSSRTIPLFQQREVYHCLTETSTFGPHVEPRSNFTSISISSSFDIKIAAGAFEIFVFVRERFF